MGFPLEITVSILENCNSVFGIKLFSTWEVVLEESFVLIITLVLQI